MGLYFFFLITIYLCWLLRKGSEQSTLCLTIGAKPVQKRVGMRMRGRVDARSWPCCFPSTDYQIQQSKAKPLRHQIGIQYKLHIDIQRWSMLHMFPSCLNLVIFSPSHFWASRSWPGVIGVDGTIWAARLLAVSPTGKGVDGQIPLSTGPTWKGFSCSPSSRSFPRGVRHVEVKKPKK